MVPRLDEPRRSLTHLVLSILLMSKTTRLIFLILATAAMGVALWALLHFAPKRPLQSADRPANLTNSSNDELWAQAVEKVKADRVEPASGQGALVVPPELRHYEDRHWFLATQVAEVRKHNIQSCQDFVALAAMIERGEMVTVPLVTDSYVLFGVGAKADDDPFSLYQDDQGIELYDEAQLRDEYARIEATRASLQSAIAKLKAQSGALKKSERTKQRELQKEITSGEQELKSNEEHKALLDQFYGRPDSREKLFREYESLRTLASNFGGRTYDIANQTDREAMKINLLRSLRPQALKVLEEIAADYHRSFDRPLPVSSLVRPEQYQHTLRKVNRNAVLIDTPPHSTGLAFDIDYRYMSAAEQTSLMADLARMKDEGRIEVLRERNANYHVFVFVDGTRPCDELITASLDAATVPVKEANHLIKEPAKAKSKQQKVKKPKARKRRK
jgi:hypothetical protein